MFGCSGGDMVPVQRPTGNAAGAPDLAAWRCALAATAVTARSNATLIDLTFIILRHSIFMTFGVEGV
jgi:hypothetical protein